MIEPSKMKTENKNPLSLINSYIKRPAEIPRKGMLSDLLWADPDPDINNKDQWIENDRGISFMFGKDIVSKFCQINDIDLICRAH